MPTSPTSRSVSRLYLFPGDLDLAAERLELALGVAEGLGSASLMARGFVLRSQLASARSRPQESLAYLERGLSIALEHDEFEYAGQLYFHLSDRAFHEDQYEKAHGYLLQTLQLAQRRGERRAQLAIHAELTWPLNMLGRWDEALELYGQISEEHILTSTTLSVLDGVIPIHINRGNLGEGQRILALFASLESAVDIQDRSSYLSGASALRLAEGRYDEALRLGVDADAVASAGFAAASQQSKLGLVVAMEAALTLGDRDRVETILEHIASIPPGLQAPYLEAHSLRFRARLDASDAGFAAAETAFRELGTPFWVAVVLLEHAELLARDGQEDDAEPLLAEARETFERLRATPWLERAAAVSRETEVPQVS